MEPARDVNDHYEEVASPLRELGLPPPDREIFIAMQQGGAGRGRGDQDCTDQSAPAEEATSGDQERLPPALSGAELLADPDAAIARYKELGGTDDALIDTYLSGASVLHILRAGSQPAMVRATLRTLVGPLARRMCTEAEVEGVSAMLLAEQAAEARADEAFARALAGTALDDLEINKAERLARMADKHSRRMMKALDQLHRLRRPQVAVTIKEAQNLNLGTQTVNQSVDTGGQQEPSRRTGSDP